MKKYLTILILFFSFTAQSQQIVYTPMSAAGYQMKYLKTDSGFALPVRDTSIGRGVDRPGLMVINSTDSLPYYYNGRFWKPVYVDSTGVIELINNKVDSVTVNGNNLFYWVAGLGYGAQLNKLDSIHVSADSIFTCIAGNCTFQYLTTAGTGTVTSIMAGFGLTGDTITTTGAIAVDTSVFHTSNWNNAAYAPIVHFHSASDIISGTLPIVRGGTGLSGIGGAGQSLRVATSGSALEYYTPPTNLSSFTNDIPFLKSADTTNKWLPKSDSLEYQKISTDFFAPGAITKEIDNGKYNFFGMIGITQNRTLYAAYREATNHVGSVGVIKFITSNDKGRTWSAPKTIASGTLDYRNVGGGTTPTGRIIISYTTYDTATATFVNMYSINSDDNGVTWSAPVLVGKAGMTTFSTYGKVIPIGSNTLMLPWYSVIPYYGAWGVKSIDNGATWGTPFLIDSSNMLHYSESNYTYLGNNSILGMLREDNSNHIRQVLSTDNGATWVDKGNALFDSSANGMMCWLSTFTAVNNKKVVECAYANRDSGKIRVVYGYADNLITNGVLGWNASTVANVGNIPPGGGYPTVVHYSNHPAGLGWSANDSLSTDNANGIGWYGFEKSGSNVSLEFFTVPLGANNFTGTSNQFMKGDGSFDTTAYAQANKYLPLTAGNGSPITGNVYFTPPAASGFNNILINGNSSLTGGLLIQPGGGSGAYGGGLKLYSHSNATKPGWVTAGISSGSGGKFSVNTAGNGTGTDVFTVDASGHVMVEGITSTGATGTGKIVFDASPALGGTPTTPTATAGTNTTQIASTAFVSTAVTNAVASYLPLAAGSAAALSGNLYLTPVAGGSRYILLNGNNTLTGSLNLQAGGGSGAYGGGVIMYSGSHTTKAGWVTVGLSNTTSKFSVNNNGLGTGTDVFTVDYLGNAVGLSFAKSGGNSSQFLKADGSVDNTAYTPTSRTVNGHALSSNVTVTYPDIPADAIANGTTATTQVNTDSSGKLATTAFVKKIIKLDSTIIYAARGIKADTTLNPGYTTLVLDSAYIRDSVMAGSGSSTEGTYTPTITGIANYASGTAYVCRYMRTGNTVTVYGKVTVQPTATATITTFSLSLPVASTFTSSYDAAGTGGGIFSGTYYPYVISSASAGSVLNVSFISNQTSGEQDCQFTATYKVL